MTKYNKAEKTLEKVFAAMNKHVQPLIDKHVNQCTNDADLLRDELQILGNFHSGIVKQILEIFDKHEALFNGNSDAAFNEFIDGNIALAVLPTPPKDAGN
tara:strand:+ start:612 stop:911 length:300 start_codon:yes stop_codon:yes gene_type:complete